jgi:hypothetical protein
LCLPWSDLEHRSVLARIVETPHLARVVPRLPAQILHRVIERCGLEDSGELLALTTPEQLSAVFDLDLWRSRRAGVDEEFDAERFGVWLEVLVEGGVTGAAEKLTGVDPSLVTVALSRYVSVFDPAAFTRGAKQTLHAEIGGYLVVAKRADAWDALTAVLAAMEGGHRDAFHRVMIGCRRQSDSTPEADGFHHLLTPVEQVRFDLAEARERRRERQGFMTPAQARAFLQEARTVRLDQPGPPPPSPLFSAYVREHDPATGDATETETGTAAEVGDSTAEQSATEVAAVVAVLVDAGVLHDRPRALLPGTGDPAEGPSRIEEQMRLLRERDPLAHESRSGEVAFLANVLMAGCAVRDRAFTPEEAFEAVLAVCNLGLENWPEGWPPPERQDFPAIFQVGWVVLYRDVGLFVAEQLLLVLRGIRSADRELQLGVRGLRRELARQCAAGTPWQARQALDVLSNLDLSAWAAMTGLIAECPVMLANVSAGASRPLTVDPSAFDFIAENRHIASVRDFVRRLPELLTR